MAWVNFTTPETIGDAYANYGTVSLQYDNSTTGSSRACRLYFQLDPDTTIYVYFNDVTINGTQREAQVLVTGTQVVWSGTLNAGTCSYSFSCPWYTGTTSYGASGTLPSGYVAPTTPTISATAISPTEVQVTYGTTSFGTPNTGTVTLYGGTSSAPTTSVDTTNTTGDKVASLTGLIPNTTYYYRARANNGQLNSDYSTEVSVTLPNTPSLYGSVNGETKKIDKLYGSILKVVTVYYVTSVYSMANFNAAKFNNAYYNKFGMMTKHPASLSMQGNSSRGEIYINFSDNSHELLAYWTSNSQFVTIQLNWGLSGTTAPSPWGVTSTSNTTTEEVSKKITKLYGSVNGETKLIFSN